MSSKRAAKALSSACASSRSVAGPSRYYATGPSDAGPSNTSTNPAPPSSPSTTPSTAESSWAPVLPPGKNPAYDEALSYLSSHRARLLSRISLLSTLAPSPEHTATIERLTVAANVNDPATRRLFRLTGGKGYMDQPTMRHLAERRWVKEGGLDLLMQRVHQMGVVPDLIPRVGATAPLEIHTAGEVVEPGSIQPPSKFSAPPRIRLQLFTPQEGMHTLLVIDPDSPRHETHSYGHHIHYAKTDIPLSVLSGEADLISALGTERLSWQPPLPPKGTGKHRYVFVVLRQSTDSSLTFDDRTADIRPLLATSDIVGLSLVRSQWTVEEDQYIRAKHREVHGEGIREYSKPPKEMRFGYPPSAQQRKNAAAQREAWDAAIEGMVAGLGAGHDGREVQVARE